MAELAPLPRQINVWCKVQTRSIRDELRRHLIDEVDELNHYDPRINQGLRSLFMKRFAQSLAAVVAVGVMLGSLRVTEPPAGWLSFTPRGWRVPRARSRSVPRLRV